MWEEKETPAYDHALRAEALDPNDPVVQMILGRIEQYRRDFEQAGARLERARRLRLLEEIRKATGLGGRERKMGDVAERVRSTVT